MPAYSKPINSEPVAVTQAAKIQEIMSIAHVLVQPATALNGNEVMEVGTPSVPATARNDSDMAESGTSSVPPSPLSEGNSSYAATPSTAITETEEGDVSPEEAVNDDVPDDQREFICINDEHTRCQTGQYTKDLSRKVISDHFGRNKACTRDITEWPLFCRKHYQRATYDKPKWQIRKIHLILRQLRLIENQFPSATYDVTLKKSEETRLNQYSRHIASGLTSSDARDRVAPTKGKSFEAPIDILRELDQFLGQGKTYKEAKDIMDVILQMLEGKECEQVPAIEFLPQLPGKAAPSKKAPVKGRATMANRVSKKGGVKKTGKKA